MKREHQYIDIEIDKLTSSIENVRTGDSFRTDVSLLEKKELLSITKSNGCLFMGLIREPLDVDFFVDPKPLAEKDKKMISDFIKADKAKRRNKKISKKSTRTQSV